MTRQQDVEKKNLLTMLKRAKAEAKPVAKATKKGGGASAPLAAKRGERSAAGQGKYEHQASSITWTTSACRP